MLGPRDDFRVSTSLRPIQCRDIGLISEAIGSGKYSIGKTCVTASVYGPAQPRFSRHDLHDRGCLEIDFTWLGSDASEDAQEDEDALYLKNIFAQAVQLKRFPRMLIIIKVLVIRNDGGTRAAAINAVTLSLLDAKLPMYYTPVG